MEDDFSDLVSTACTISGLTNEVTLSVTVIARNAAGASSPKVLSVTPTALG
jgi:hypothetical protein